MLLRHLKDKHSGMNEFMLTLACPSDCAWKNPRTLSFKEIESEKIKCLQDMISKCVCKVDGRRSVILSKPLADIEKQKMTLKTGVEALKEIAKVKMEPGVDNEKK